MGAWKLTYVPSEPIPQKPISFTELSLLYHYRYRDFLKAKTDTLFKQIKRDMKQNPETYDKERRDETIKLLETLKDTLNTISSLHYIRKLELIREHPQAHNLRHVLPL